MSGQQAIRGSVALVTGANRGIGKAIVEALVAHGAAKVYAGARRTEALAELVKAHSGRVVPLPLDVTDPGQVAALAQTADDVTILVNNAGVAAAALGASIADPTINDAARTEMEVNYFGTLHVIQALAPSLARNGGGTIVNVASVAGLTAFPPLSSYSASKAALRSLTQAARVHLARQGTRVVGVYPGPVDTDMAREISFEKASAPSVAEQIVEAIEQGTLEVYPDPFAVDFGKRFEASPSELEQHVTALVSAA